MILLFGASGSGKSSQAALLVKKMGWKWLSSGQIVRESGYDKEDLSSGNLTPDEFVIRLVDKELKKNLAKAPNVLLDGFPRTEAQVRWLLSNYRKEIQGVILINVAREELLKRLELRGRMDDDLDAIKLKLDTFDREIYPILGIFEKDGVRVAEVDGNGTMMEVAYEVEDLLSEWGLVQLGNGQ